LVCKIIKLKIIEFDVSYQMHFANLCESFICDIF